MSIRAASRSKPAGRMALDSRPSEQKFFCFKGPSVRWGSVWAAQKLNTAEESGSGWESWGLGREAGPGDAVWVLWAQALVPLWLRRRGLGREAPSCLL